MNPHIFFVDIDGTLLRSGTPLSPAVARAATRFREAGGRIALCTGRSPLSTTRLARSMNIDTPCVLCSGAAVYDFAGGTATATTPLPDDVRERIPRMMRDHPDASVQAYTIERAYLLQSSALLRERGIKEEVEAETSSLDDVSGEMLKLVLTHPDPEVMRERIARYFDEQYHFAFASKRFAEVVAGGADKGAAARAVAAFLGIPMERTFAAGDAGTDIPLLAACGYSFAPRDARPEVVEMADEVIPSCDDDGMAAGFERAVERMNGAR